MQIPESPRALGLPYDEWRTGQRLALRTALHSKTRHTVIQAPTGSGKSLMGGGLTQLDERRQVILTATKSLEDQYSATYDHLFDVRGMANYPCRAAKDQFVKLFRHRRSVVMCDEGPCRSGLACARKESGCDYFDTVREAVASRSPMTNYKYWLAMRRYGRGLGAVARVICDEAHALPEELMSAYRIEIPLTLVQGNPPTTPKGWAEWAAQLMDELKPQGADDEDSRVRKQRLIDNLEHLTRIDDTWAWDVYEHVVSFEPTIPRLLLKTLAGDDIPKLVYLSATITPGTLRLLDIPDHEVTFQIMRSRFPVERRPIYCLDTCRVDHRMTADMVAWWLGRIDKIIEKRLDRKGIIHTVSYQRALDILKGSKYAKIMLAPLRGRDLPSALSQFRSARAPMILLSPAITTGLDFPGTDAEYQIIAKLPFPDTRSAIAKARIAATEGYRDHLWTQNLIQACGRLMRSEGDQGETFIVDGHHKWALPKANRAGLLPAWFWDAVSWERKIPAPPPALGTLRAEVSFARTRGY